MRRRKRKWSERLRRMRRSRWKRQKQEGASS